MISVLLSFLLLLRVLKSVIRRFVAPLFAAAGAPLVGRLLYAHLVLFDS